MITWDGTFEMQFECRLTAGWTAGVLQEIGALYYLDGPPRAARKRRREESGGE